MGIQKLLLNGGVTKDGRQFTDILTHTDTNLEDRFAHCKNIFLHVGFTRQAGADWPEGVDTATTYARTGVFERT